MWQSQKSSLWVSLSAFLVAAGITGSAALAALDDQSPPQSNPDAITSEWFYDDVNQYRGVDVSANKVSIDFAAFNYSGSELADYLLSADGPAGIHEAIRKYGITFYLPNLLPASVKSSKIELVQRACERLKNAGFQLTQKRDHSFAGVKIKEREYVSDTKWAVTLTTPLTANAAKPAKVVAVRGAKVKIDLAAFNYDGREVAKYLSGAEGPAGIHEAIRQYGITFYLPKTLPDNITATKQQLVGMACAQLEQDGFQLTNIGSNTYAKVDIVDHELSADGIMPSKTVLSKQEGTAEFRPERGDFIEDLKSYIRQNGDGWRSQKITILRIVQDQFGHSFSDAEIAQLKGVASNYGLTVRLENFTNRDEQRARAADLVAQQQAAEMNAAAAKKMETNEIASTLADFEDQLKIKETSTEKKPAAEIVDGKVVIDFEQLNFDPARLASYLKYEGPAGVYEAIRKNGVLFDLPSILPASITVTEQELVHRACQTLKNEGFPLQQNSKSQFQGLAVKHHITKDQLADIKKEAIEKLIKEAVDPFFSENKISPLDQATILKKLRGLATDKSFGEKFENFFYEIYQKPNRTEVISGLTKATVAMTFGMMGYMSNPAIHLKSPLVWAVIARNGLFEATIWGPFLKTYLNWLEKYINRPYGGFASSVWGQILGFGLYAGYDVSLLHFSNPAGIAPAWSWQFESKYWGMGTLGGLLGGFSAPGFFNLRSKGYLTGTQVQVIAQMFDVIMPFEGALLASNSALIFPVFFTQNMLKFGIYVVSKNLEAKGIATIMPERITNTGYVQNAYRIKEFVNNDLLAKAKTAEFLRSDHSMQTKLAVLDYLLRVQKGVRKLGQEPNSEFKAAIDTYVAYMKEKNFGRDLQKKIYEKAQSYYQVNEVSVRSMDSKVQNTTLRILDQKSRIKGEVANLRKELIQIKKMASMLTQAVADDENISFKSELAEATELKIPPKISLLKNLAKSLLSIDPCERYLLFQ